jgi:hypothetical protein
MKVTRFPLFVFSAVSVFALFTAASCKKSNNSSSGSGVSATVSGTAFNPSTTVALYSESGQSWEITGYTIKSGDTSVIDMTINKMFPSPLNYPQFNLNQPFTTDTTSAYVDYYANGVNGKYYDASDGNGKATLTVTALDTTAHTIAGTFYGTLYASASDSVVVTNGKFNTTYKVGP